MIEVNKYQTPITDELLASLPGEVRDKFLECINSIPFIQHLISPKRLRAKDLRRDKNGKIIIDLTHPHIVEDVDYFCPTALHYSEFGTLTSLKPNSNPNSEFGKWIREERRRCWEGYVRESDGEWVTGYMYWFLNYCPIMLTKIRKGTKRADRVQAMPEFWEGIYWRFHYLEQASNAGKHCAELSRRGSGKSFVLASILSHILVLGENEEAHEKVTGIVTAYQREYLVKDGVLNKFVDMVNFCATHTQFPRRKLKSSLQEMTWIMGYKDAESNIDKGTQNTVIGVSSKDDESKLRGKRAAKILFEEAGTFARLIETYNNMLPSVQEGDIVYGQLALVGTSGDEASDFEGFKELLYNPVGYDIYALDNVYDQANRGRTKFAFFYPAYVNRKGCYNKDGVSDVVKALIEILMNRYRVKYNSSDPNTITKTIAEMPITPAEALTRVSYNIFPVTDLNERLMQLDSNPNEWNDVYVGDLNLDKSNKVVFTPSAKLPIRDFPHKDNKIEGAIEIFQMPEVDKSMDRPYSNRYLGGIDTVDSDEAESMSLGSIFILDLWTDRIVAEYTGRPMYADDFYEKCRRLGMLYNAKLNYENNLKGLFAYFSARNSAHILSDTLEFLKDKQLVKESYGNQAKGVHATLPVNNYARNLLRTWLLSPIKVIKEVDGKKEEVTMPKLYTLRNRALIKELINYNSVGNFDRISAMGMLMLLREDRMIMYQNDINPDNLKNVNKNYLGNDPFFTDNYKFVKGKE